MHTHAALPAFQSFPSHTRRHLTRPPPSPHADFVASSLSFGAAAVVINMELSSFIPTSTWFVRMPLVATFAAEVAKLRGVLVHTEDQTQNYFFWLFVAQAVLEGSLALWAVTIACPPKCMLHPSRELESAYEVRASRCSLSCMRVCAVCMTGRPRWSGAERRPFGHAFGRPVVIINDI